TPNHNLISGNFYAALKYALKGKPYRVFMTDLRLWIPESRLYTYPDVMVVAIPLVYAENRRDTITNPLIIAEILSNSTESYDRGKKFEYYRSMSSFQEYILIDQYRNHVEQFSKTEEGKWLLSEFSNPEDILYLSSVESGISLQDIYEEVEFEE
ncbi:Uma2 family endonuclease, partial [Okeania sp. SIO2B9]